MSTNLGRGYPWVEPTSVNSESKYRLRYDGRITLTHVTGRIEHSLETSSPHDRLVEMVRSVKSSRGDQPSGVFYINEWRHVLVKAAGGTWYAGTYDTILEFTLDGRTISPRASVECRPGDAWDGPRVGVRYTITAGGDDIYCTVRLDKRTERQEFLSDYVSDAAEFVQEISCFRPQGGRIYINEARELFSPAPTGGHVYLGYAGIDRWFPEPQAD